MNRIEQIQQFLKNSPGDPFLLHALALEHIKINDNSAARQIFENLLSERPDYVGSYYHLAGLLVKMGEQELAVEWYQKGMDVARKAGDQHALRELQSALEELIF
jgi:tetratricopeptide (TPR) repeat protein